MNQRRSPWLAILTVGAVIVLVAQLRPSLWRDLLWLLDVRNWTALAWFLANVVVLLVLIAIRFGHKARIFLPTRHRGLENEADSD